MIFEKDTGNIIIDENHVLKARMTKEEMMNSNIKDMLIENVEEIKQQDILSFKKMVVDGINTDISIYISNWKVRSVRIEIDDAGSKCYYGINHDEFVELVDKHEEFMKKMLNVKYIPIGDSVDFDGGYAELEVVPREPSVNIKITYHGNNYRGLSIL